MALIWRRRQSHSDPRDIKRLYRMTVAAIGDALINGRYLTPPQLGELLANARPSSTGRLMPALDQPLDPDLSAEASA